MSDTTVRTTPADAARRFAGTVNGDAPDPGFEDLFAETVAVWHNFDDEPTPIPSVALASTLRQEAEVMSKHLADYRHDDVRLRVFEDGFALSRTTRATLPDGSALVLSQCLVNYLEDGRIVRSEAFLDRQQAAPLYAFLGELVASGDFKPAIAG